jgi:hypothetical protein
MRPLSTSELLGVWKLGLAEHPVERAHALLVVACPETSPDEFLVSRNHHFRPSHPQSTLRTR